ncbi:MAG: hypothetical protein LC099_03600 [Anaerolineales bacterium]|nr:hypothetical protein [Anaerolineales bacterium]
MRKKLPIRKYKERILYYINRRTRSNRDETKIFCIGGNKTGTTSIGSFFRTNGYKVGNQHAAEMLIDDWAKRDFSKLIEYCRSAEVFQDIPFSLPDTYRALDEAFPNSKFILTIRSSAEEWYNSVVTFHSKITRSATKPPKEDDLKRFVYRGKYAAWLLRVQELVYGYPNVPLYDPQSYMAQYEEHNSQIQKYFEGREDDLLVLNLKEKDAHERLCNFVGLNPAKAIPIPHLNRSATR